MCIKKVNSDAIKLYENTEVKLKITRNTREVQFTAGNNTFCPLQNISKDKYMIRLLVRLKTVRKQIIVTKSPKSGKYSITVSQDRLQHSVLGEFNSNGGHEYDGCGRLKAKSACGRTLLKYEYDLNGNKTAVTDVTGKTTHYEYDRTEHKINDEITEKYSYNEVNELLSVERSTKYGSENEIRNFTYDPDGNMTSDGRGIYKYDSLNRMTEAVMEDGRKLLCRYDAEGLRHETEENGRLIRFIYSGRDAVCEEADDNITRHIRGNGSLVSSDSENARTYYHYACDSLGSITHVM